MFKLIAFACLLAVVAAKPGLLGAPIAYTAPAVYSAAPIATSYSASYAAPAYQASYAAPAYPAYSAYKSVVAPVVAPVAYKSYGHGYSAPLTYSAPIVSAYGYGNGGSW